MDREEEAQGTVYLGNRTGANQVSIRGARNIRIRRHICIPAGEHVLACPRSRPTTITIVIVQSLPSARPLSAGLRFP